MITLSDVGCSAGCSVQVWADHWVSVSCQCGVQVVSADNSDHVTLSKVSSRWTWRGVSEWECSKVIWLSSLSYDINRNHEQTGWWPVWGLSPEMQRLGEKTDTAGNKEGQEVNYECGRNTHSLKCQCWKKTGISNTAQDTHCSQAGGSRRQSLVQRQEINENSERLHQSTYI